MMHLKPRPTGWVCYLLALVGLEPILMCKKDAVGYQKDDDPRSMAQRRLHTNSKGEPFIPREMLWSAIAPLAQDRVLPDGRIVRVEAVEDTKRTKYVRLKNVIHISGKGLELICNGWQPDIRQGSKNRTTKVGIVRPRIDLPWQANGHICVAPNCTEFVQELLEDAGTTQGFGSYRAENEGYMGIFQLGGLRSV